MTVRFPTGDDDGGQQTAANTDQSVRKFQQDSKETPPADQNETALLRDLPQPNDLPQELSPKERAQAMQALAFLNEVRDESPSTSRSPAISQIPKQIGRYSIVRSIGRGGFAEVFLAEDEELDRRVALKIPLFDSSRNEAARQRFEREAKLAASLGHPQIVPVYEYGDLGAVRFIAFAWCDGPNLSQWIKDNGKVDSRTAAQIVKHLAEAVQHAHQRGIVHRDLKPGNVLVDASSEVSDQPVWERLRITDFGLARNYETDDATLTQDGQLVGTPAYMSPEQARGESEIRATSDIYALGVTLYELLTGKVPFVESGHLATIRAVESETPTPPGKIDQSIPRDLDAICQKCLCKSPSDRYSTAFELGNELNSFLNNRPVKVRPPSALLRLKRWAVSNQKLAAAIAFAMTSLLVGLGISLWQWNVANHASSRANEEAGRAIREAERVSSNLTSTFQAIDLMLDGIDPDNPGAVPDSQRKVLQVILKLQQDIVEDPAAEGFALSKLETLARMMKIHQFLGQYPEAQKLGEENFDFLSSLDFANSELPDVRELWRLTDEVFQVYLFAVYKSRRYDEAAKAIAQFEPLAAKAEHLLEPIENALLQIQILTQKGNVLDKSRNLRESLAVRKAASELVAESLGEGDVDQRENLLQQQVHCLGKLARSQYLNRMKEESRATIEQVIDLQRDFMAEFPDTEEGEKTLAFHILDSARYQASGGNLEQSIRQCNEGIEVLENELKKRPNDNDCREKLSWAYSQTVFRMYNARKRHPELAISNEKALANLEKAVGLVEIGLLDSRLGCSKYLEALNLKARVLVEMKRFEDAEPVAEEAVEFAERNGFSKDEGEAQTHSVVRAYHYLAKAKVGIGDSAAIVKVAQQLRAILDSEDAKYGPDHRSTWKRIRHTSRIWILSEETIHLAKLGRFEDAVERIRERMQTVHASGRLANQVRYYSGAEHYAKAIAIFRESENYSEAKERAAETEMLEWLELALDKGHIRNLKGLDRSFWNPFRENPQFAAIYNRAQKGMSNKNQSK